MKNAAFTLIALVSLTAWMQASTADRAGYVLIDKFVVLFEGITSSSGGDVDPGLQEMMAMAKKAKAEGRLTQEFFDRYARLLMVVKLAMIPDRERILAPLADIQFKAFVRDVSGAPVQDTPPSIAALAKAITQELDNLKKVLDQQNR
ncbi:MAG: hypothetical protein EHM61_19015 [Acidobacteria bacterium]|nr:MAG: hypothetical protein EHM61_19015 [Acidobacteriota bacterium]